MGRLPMYMERGEYPDGKRTLFADLSGPPPCMSGAKRPGPRVILLLPFELASPPPLSPACCFILSLKLARDSPGAGQSVRLCVREGVDVYIDVCVYVHTYIWGPRGSPGDVT